LSSQVPWDELDPPVVELCRAINALPDVATVASCGGHEPAAMSGASAPANEWWVSYQVVLDDERPTEMGWHSLEFLAWAFREMMRGGLAIRPMYHASPPFLNEPGHMLVFQVDGRRDGQGGVEADRVAQELAEMVDEFFSADVGEGEQ
jgi:hypothetical protein